MQRFALLGAGFIGSVHAANLAAHPDVDFALVYGLDHRRGLNRRFDHDYAMLPLTYIAVSGGQMRDQTVHFFDLARWIADLDPTEVFATGSTLAEPRLTDYGDVDTSTRALTTGKSETITY
jgi:predicted dehydrogenase